MLPSSLVRRSVQIGDYPPPQPPEHQKNGRELLAAQNSILRSSNKLLLLPEQLPCACLVLGRFLS